MRQITQDSLQTFEEELLAPETRVYDPIGVHHEFNQTLHGRKVDMDEVVEGTPLYERWIYHKSKFVSSLYRTEILKGTVLLGIADGSNRVARDVAAELGDGVKALETKKISKGHVELTEEAIQELQSINPLLAVAIEDVGTRGTTSVTGVVSINQNRNPNLEGAEVVHSLLRGVPEWLAALNIAYYAMIDRKMRDYTAEECQASGYCAQGWKLVPHGQ